MCLDAINYIAKSAIDPDLNFVQANFASIGFMRPLWDNSDVSICLTSCSICALLARQIFRGSLEMQWLPWLHEVIGENLDAIRDANSKNTPDNERKKSDCPNSCRRIHPIPNKSARNADTHRNRAHQTNPRIHVGRRLVPKDRP